MNAFEVTQPEIGAQRAGVAVDASFDDFWVSTLQSDVDIDVLG